MDRRQALNILLKSAAATGATVLGVMVISDWRSTRRIKPIFAMNWLTSDQALPEHLLTPVNEFYVQSYALLAPNLNAEAWQLSIDGMVQTPLNFSYKEVLAAPQEEFYLTMECIGNPIGGNLIGNALWTGTPLWPFLEKAEIKPQATQVVMHGADSYETALPVAELLKPGVRLVHRMNGEPLTKEHGYPMRLIIPSHYGQKQPKWVVRLEAISDRKLGYWERQGWSNTAVIPTHSLIRQLQSTRVWNRHHQATFSKTGEDNWTDGVWITGVALDGQSSIANIWVSVDNGQTWQQAEKNNPVSPHEWTLWRYRWQPKRAGKYIVLAKAETERSQQPLDDKQAKDGSVGALRIQVTLQS